MLRPLPGLCATTGLVTAASEDHLLVESAAAKYPHSVPTPILRGLLLFLGVAASAVAQPPSGGSRAPSASPTPAPRYKLVPYGFETAQERSAAPLLRFEDQAEVRGLEMNAAIARFFEKTDEKGNMLRGATPGGAPPLREMGPYRPHVSPALNLLGAVLLGVNEVRKQPRSGSMPAASPSPTPTPPALRP